MSRSMIDPLSKHSKLALGVLLGASIGIVAGIAELLLQPLDEIARVPFVIGADGLVGGAFGLACAVSLLGRRQGLAETAGVLAGLVTAPVLIAGLGLFANRVLLSGTHFLSPASLALDAVAVGAGVALAVAIARAARRVLASRAGARAPGFVAVAGALVPLGLAFVGPARLLARGAPAGDLPTIVLVSIDTLRPDRLSGGGEPIPTSPELDRLAREGVFFSEALAASPGSAASHAALLTSRYPVSNGVWSNFSVLDESVLTLAEQLREMGYRTGGFVTNTFLGKRFQFDQGFDSYVESGVVERLEEPSRASLKRSLAINQIVDRVRGRLEPGYDPSFETALQWIRETDRPTFFFVHLMDVHSPYVPPHPYGPRFDADRAGALGGRDRANRFGWRPSEEAYLAEIRFADYKIGRLRKALEAKGILDGSVIVVTSDHGENLLDHEPHFSHGTTLFDATLRIVASFRAPGRLAAGRVVPEVFENVDVIPSLAVLLGWDRSPAWEGRDAFDEESVPERATFSQLNRDFAVRTREWKAILKESGAPEFYSLEADPGERSRADASPDRIAAFRQRLREWFDAHATELYLENSRTVRPEELSPEVVEKLKGLGYL